MPTTPKILRASFHRQCLSLFVFAAMLAACATAGNGNRADVYRIGDDYVRLEPIERGAPANSHPFAISDDQLRGLLTPLKVNRAGSIDRAPVFRDEELNTIVPPLVSALSKADPNQDVTFAVTSYRGVLGKLSPKSITTGRLFVSGNTINLIFGVMQQRLDSENLEPVVSVPRAISSGTRSRRVDTTVWTIDPVGGYFHHQRGDWVVFDRAAL